MLGDGAELIEKLPIVNVPVGAALEWHVGLVANSKSKHGGMITVTLRQPLSSALDIHSLGAHQRGIGTGCRKGEPWIDRYADDYINRVGAMIPAQVQELIAAVVRRPSGETRGRRRRAEADSGRHAPVERAPLRIVGRRRRNPFPPGVGADAVGAELTDESVGKIDARFAVVVGRAPKIARPDWRVGEMSGIAPEVIRAG